MVNRFGCQKECANHLGVDKSTISRHVKALIEAGQLEPSESEQGKRTDLKRSCTVQPPVENRGDLRKSLQGSNSQIGEKIPDHPPMQPVEDLLDEAQQRVKELEAELKQLREEAKSAVDRNVKGFVSELHGTVTSEFDPLKNLPLDERLGGGALITTLFVSTMLSQLEPTMDELLDDYKAAGATFYDQGSMDLEQWHKYNSFMEPLLDLGQACDALKAAACGLDKQEPEESNEPEPS